LKKRGKLGRNKAKKYRLQIIQSSNLIWENFLKDEKARKQREKGSCFIKFIEKF